MDALSIPPAALRDQDSVELSRVWIAEQGLHCSIKIGMYAETGGGPKEVAAWGKILADLAQHVADALSVEGFGSRDALIDSLVQNFNDEISTPTSSRKGEFGPRAN